MSHQNQQDEKKGLKYSKATMILLEDLESAKTDQNADKVEKIITNAKTEIYNDFLSSHATPQILLHSHLQDAGLQNLAKNVIEGKYDD